MRIYTKGWRGMAVGTLLLAATGVGLGGVIDLSGPAAATETPVFNVVGTSQAHPKQPVEVHGKNFTAGSKVLLTFDGSAIGTVTAGTSGIFYQTITVPAKALPGSHRLAALDAAGDKATSTLTVRTNWVHDGFTEGRDSTNPFENVLSSANVTGLTQAWSDQGTGGVAEQAAIVNGVDYFCVQDPHGEGNGALTAVDASTGQDLWHTGGGCDDTPLVVGNDIYSINEGSLTAFTLSGVEQWVTPTPVGSQVLASDGTYIYTNGPGVVDMATGQVVWANGGSEHGGYDPSADPAYSPGMFVVPRGHAIDGVDPITGDVAWTFSTAGLANCDPTIAGNVVYVGDPNDLYALDLTTGSLLWEDNFAGANAVANASPVVSGTSLYLLTTSGVDDLDITTGSLGWTSTAVSGGGVGGQGVTFGAEANGVLYVAADTGSVVALDASTGSTLWSTPLTADSPAVVNGYLYLDAGPEVAYTLPS